MDRELALEALSAVCNAKVTSVQQQKSAPLLGAGAVAAPPPLLSVKKLISVVLDKDDCCQTSRAHFANIRAGVFGQAALRVLRSLDVDEDTTGKPFIIDEDEFFDPGYDYDFTDLKDTETYYRGGEVYERPCGWYRFALKVLDKYGDDTWLGNLYRSTDSVEGEWPVSYHGTSQTGAEGIIEGHYKPGSGQVYGRGIYSSPFISEAIDYTSSFISKKTGKRYIVIVQNRINPKYREKHYQDKYWLVSIPSVTSKKEEEELVDRAIRPYGLLLKEA